MKKRKVPEKVKKKVEHWKLRGFSCPQHAAGFNYFNRSDTEEDMTEINEYCGE